MKPFLITLFILTAFGATLYLIYLEESRIAGGEWESKTESLESYTFRTSEGIFNFGSITIETTHLAKQYNLNNSASTGELYFVKGTGPQINVVTYEYLVDSDVLDTITLLELSEESMRDFSSDYLNEFNRNIPIYTYEQLNEEINNYKKYSKLVTSEHN